MRQAVGFEGSASTFFSTLETHPHHTDLFNTETRKNSDLKLAQHYTHHGV